MRTILRVANLVLVVTPYEEDSKVKMGASRKKCILFPGGVDDNSFVTFASTNPEEFLQQLKLNSDAKIVAYLGTIEERKNPKAVLDVAEKLQDRKDVWFVIAGRGDSEYAEEVKKRAEQLPNVTFLGEIGEREKVQLIKISHLNILLSRMEALGLTQLEFMFQGVPIITSGVGGQSWIIKHDQEGIHVKGPADVEGATRAVEELIDDRSKWHRLSVNAKKKAKDFAFTKLIRDLDAAITKEMEMEIGLTQLPSEVRATLSEPEPVIRSWSHGNQKLAATSERVFIQKGRWSRKTIEIPYSSIGAIEHIRRYDWQTLVIGAGLSLLLFIQHYLFPIISSIVTSGIVVFITDFFPTIKMELSPIRTSIWLAPISVASLLFLVRARKGYILRGGTLGPIYLPHSFREAIQYIRQSQDQFRSIRNANENKLRKGISK